VLSLARGIIRCAATCGAGDRGGCADGAAGIGSGSQTRPSTSAKMRRLRRCDGSLTSEPSDHLVAWIGTSLCGSAAAMREPSHPGTEDRVNVIHALDLRQAVPLAPVDTALVPLV
jgi:hypothetical protein